MFTVWGKAKSRSREQKNQYNLSFFTKVHSNSLIGAFCNASVSSVIFQPLCLGSTLYRGQPFFSAKAGWDMRRIAITCSITSEASVLASASKFALDF